MQEKYFQGIHDRFIRDQEFGNRMIENHRDEEPRRRWDALAEEDHTHHLTSQEYSLYKSNWWLHSNKQDSNTMPVTHRADFHKRPLTLTEINNGHRVLLLLHGGIGKVHGVLLSLMKVTMEMHQVLTERADLLNSVFEKFFWTRLS